MATPFLQVSRDAQQALTEFSQAFDAALVVAEAQQWSKGFGLGNSSRAIKTTYPIPVSAAGYHLRQGDDKFRRLYEKSISMKPVEWQDGVSELASVIEAPDFIGWASEPERMAREAARHPNVLVAAVLEDNPTLEFDGKALFAGDHPFNIFQTGAGDFDNDISGSGFNADLIKTVRQHFRSIKGPNGKPLGLRLTDMLVPAAQEESAKEFFESDLIYNATLAGASNTNLASNNIYKGAANLVVSDELTNDDVIYAIAKMGPPPYVLQDGGEPEQIIFDKTDHMYKTTGRLAFSSVLLAAAAAALPHAILRITFS